MSGFDGGGVNDQRSGGASAARPVLCVVGARPNYMKMAPIIRALAAHGDAVPPVLVHTGQHYDAAMNDSFFTALGMPRPAVNLEVGSATHAVQTAEIMKRFEPVLDAYDPAAVLVVGDVNSTIACALVAAKKGVPVVHVEAGLRSYDRAMPEEINRVLTDQIADLLYTTERSAAVEPQGRGHRRRAHRVRRQRDDRHAARESRVRGRRVDDARRPADRICGVRRRRPAALRRRHAAPAVERRRRRDARATARRARDDRDAAAARRSRCIRARRRASPSSGSPTRSTRRASRSCRRRAISRCSG